MNKILLNAPSLRTYTKDSGYGKDECFATDQITQFSEDIRIVCEELELVTLWEIFIISKMLDKISLNKLGGGD